MTSATTQRRLATLLIGAIYAIANSLFPVIDTIVRQPTRPWPQRASYAARFSRILQQLLGLTARIRPSTLSINPAFPTRPPPATPRPSTAHATTPPNLPRPPNPRRPALLFSARQVAQRLATLLRQLEQLAAEVGATLPTITHRNVARARAIAGCDALPNPTIRQASWERAG